MEIVITILLICASILFGAVIGAWAAIGAWSEATDDKTPVVIPVILWSTVVLLFMAFGAMIFSPLTTHAVTTHVLVQVEVPLTFENASTTRALAIENGVERWNNCSVREQLHPRPLVIKNKDGLLSVLLEDASIMSYQWETVYIAGSATDVLTLKWENATGYVINGNFTWGPCSG
jgi:hypothetical protein